jgi:hypothetical protein
VKGKVSETNICNTSLKNYIHSYNIHTMDDRRNIKYDEEVRWVTGTD